MGRGVPAPMASVRERRESQEQLEKEVHALRSLQKGLIPPALRPASSDQASRPLGLVAFHPCQGYPVLGHWTRAPCDGTHRQGRKSPSVNGPMGRAA